jgi:transposase
MIVQKRRNYTDEFKQDTVKLVTEQGYRVPEAARNLGINTGMLRRWIKNAADQSEDAQSTKGNLTKEQERIRELEEENRRLKMEREILKKVTACVL